MLQVSKKEQRILWKKTQRNEGVYNGSFKRLQKLFYFDEKGKNVIYKNQV